MRSWLAGLVFVAGCLSACTTSDGSAAEPSLLEPDAGVPSSAGTTNGAPLEARTGASMVWTGEEVIVSGGFARAPNNSEIDDANFLSDGAAYDPTDGSWRPIAESPADPMTWPHAEWTGEEMLIVGSAGGWSFDLLTNEWRRLPDPPFSLPDLVRDNDAFEAVWSGELLYVWRPNTNEMAFYDPDLNSWKPMPGPGFDAYPAELLADDSRLVALGTGWPSSGVPVSYDVVAAEWVDDRWLQYEPVTFRTERSNSIADVDAAVLVDGAIAVWGDYSDGVGPTQLLEADGTWTAAPSMPLYAGMGHPGSIQLGRRILALTEGAEVAIFDPDDQNWSIHEVPWPNGGPSQSVWTGFELLTWTGTEIWSWVPPE